MLFAAPAVAAVIALAIFDQSGAVKLAVAIVIALVIASLAARLVVARIERLRGLLERDDELYWPTHGTCIREPQAFVRAFIAHRQDRERQILACMGEGFT